MTRTRRSTKGRARGYDVFDVHLHAISDSPSHREVYERAHRADFGAHRRTARTPPLFGDALMDGTLAHMDRNHVRVGVVSGDRDTALRWAASHPERFLASFVPDYAVGDHRTAAERFEGEAERGLWRGMGELGLSYHGLPLDHEALFPYYEVCERRGLPVAFHTGLDGPEPQRLVSPRFRVEYGDPLLLQDVVTRFPELRVIVMHMGWPFFDHALYLLYAYPHVYVDTAVVDWILGPAVFRRMLLEAVETAGSERVLFGSDQMAWPQMIAPAVQSLLAVKGLTPEDRRRILWGNAARLFHYETTGGR